MICNLPETQIECLTFFYLLIMVTLRLSPSPPVCCPFPSNSVLFKPHTHKVTSINLP